MKGFDPALRERQEKLESELKAWMLAALQGDQIAYQKLLNRVSGIVMAFLMKSMSPVQRSREKVEELTQDVLLSIHQKRSYYSPELPVLPWVYAIARYRLIDSIRSESRRPHAEAWDEGLEDSLEVSVPPTQGLAASEALEVEELLSVLTERQKEVLMMAKLQDLPLADIATRLNMSLSAVKVTVHRAIKTVRKTQGEGGGHRED